MKQKRNKRLLTNRSAAVALRKIATEKAKQSIQSLQSELQVLKSTSTANDKKMELRMKYSSRLDEMIHAKLQELKVQKHALKEKETSASSDDGGGGPDVMQYILRKAEIYELQESIKSMERKIEIARGNHLKKLTGQGSNDTSFHWQPKML